MADRLPIAKNTPGLDAEWEVGKSTFKSGVKYE